MCVMLLNRSPAYMGVLMPQTLHPVASIDSAECGRLDCIRRGVSPDGGVANHRNPRIESQKPPPGEDARRMQTRTSALRSLERHFVVVFDLRTASAACRC